MASRLPALGPRGEGWVAAQLVLFVLIAAAGARDILAPDAGGSWGPAALLVGSAAIVVGGFVAVRGVLDLGSSLSPFPRPVADARLVESGAYRLIRHPIYSGVVLAAIGWGMIASSGLTIVLAAALFLLFAGKSRREEAWLVAEHPGYRDYQARTKRLIPWIY